MLFFDPLYLLFAAPGMLLAFWAQFKVKSTFNRYSQVTTRRGWTGAEIADAILRVNQIRDVRIEPTQGFLSDHYDPVAKVLRLSPEVYSGRSVAAAGVAAHEVGHAIQHAQSYAPLQVRSALVPVANLGASFAPWLIIAGALLGIFGLIQIGVIFFAGAVLFQLVTLPVEFNASSRAYDQLQTLGIATSSEIGGTKQVLNAAAMTYVAAAASSVMYLLYYVSMFMGNRD